MLLEEGEIQRRLKDVDFNASAIDQSRRMLIQRTNFGLNIRKGDKSKRFGLTARSVQDDLRFHNGPKRLHESFTQ